jgi:hypothetical protein
MIHLDFLDMVSIDSIHNYDVGKINHFLRLGLWDNERFLLFLCAKEGNVSGDGTVTLG